MKKIIIFITIFFCFPIVCLANEKQTVKLNECVDGDTAKFTMKGETIKVRFLAVDTPETKHPTKGEEPFGEEASEFTCKSLSNAKKIVLEFDDKSGKTDKYNRYLAWVFIDNKLLQNELVKRGLADVKYLYGKYTYTDELKTSLEKAKEDKIGIWSNKKEDNDLNEFVKDLDIRYKFIITIILLILFCIYLHYDKKARKKFLRKGKKELETYINKKIK